MPAALTKTESGYRMAIRDVWYGYDWETGQDKQFDQWVIADLSSSGVIDPDSIRWNVNIEVTNRNLTKISMRMVISVSRPPHL